MKRIVFVALGAALVSACYETRGTDDAFVDPTLDAFVVFGPTRVDAAYAPLDAYTPPIDANVPPAPRDVDLLFVIDDSNSMGEEHEMLVSELPRLVSVLASGDVDGDGTRDVLPVRSLHVGFVTTDLGAGPHTGVPTCARGLGDDARLRARSGIAISPCSASYPSGIFAFDPSSDSASEFSATLGCIMSMGTSGCGFEQPLEAGLKALTPFGTPSWAREDLWVPRFMSVDGIPDSEDGQGDRANAGFLRPDSILAVHVISDEEDCSVRDYGLFVDDDPRFGAVPRNVRCHLFGDPAMGIVHPVDRYVNGLARLRRDPRDLVFAATVGIPPATEANAAAGDFAGVLSHPDMSPRVNADGTGMLESCDSRHGFAFPPIRSVQVAAGLASMGAHVGLGSICSTNVSGVLLAPLVARLSE